MPCVGKIALEPKKLRDALRQKSGGSGQMHRACMSRNLVTRYLSIQILE